MSTDEVATILTREFSEGAPLRDYPEWIAELVNAAVAAETERCRQLVLRRAVKAAEHDCLDAAIWLDGTAEHIHQSGGAA